MAIPEAGLPPQMQQRFLDCQQQQIVATLAAAIISASGRPHSIAEALELSHDIHFAMFPAQSLGLYQEWVKTKDARLAKVHA